MSSDAEYAREVAEEEGAWGFMIYRCTYKSDEEWSRFLQILDATVREALEAEDEVEDEGYVGLMDTLDWSVQEDPELEGASKNEVRRLVSCAVMERTLLMAFVQTVSAMGF